jgi:hypothetical protein
MDMNCAPLLADVFLFSYEAEFIQKLLHEKKKNSCGLQFDISIHVYIDGVLSMNNNQFHTSVADLIYPNELEIKDTTKCSTSALYLDILLKFDTNGKSTTQLMTDGIILISPSSTFLSYGAIFQFHLLMVFIPRI